MKRVITCCLTLFALTLAAPIGAVPYSNFYVLGDSLSDQGNMYAASTLLAGPANALPDANHYYQGRFTNGPNYVDLVSQALGLPIAPSIGGGNNFAYGGARNTYNTVETTAGGPFPVGLFPWSLTSEVAAFNARNINDPNALYLVFSGSNDVADILVRGLNPNTVIPGAVAGVLSGVQAFVNAGAKTVIVPNLPNLGLTPLFNTNPNAAAAATALSAQFNALLHAQLAQFAAGIRLIEIDTFSLLNSLVANPALFGLTNVKNTCYSGFVTPIPNGVECANPDEYLFWDLVHPTAQVHEIFARSVLFAIPEPASMLLLALGLLLMLACMRKPGFK